MKKVLLLSILLLLFSCKDHKNGGAGSHNQTGDTLAIKYAKGFSVVNYGDYKILKVKKPSPESNESYTYLLVENPGKVPGDLRYDQKVRVPIQKIILTSTTHIPALESLKEEQTLVGFPNPNYISSPKTRERIENNKIANIGKSSNLNLEVLLSLQPDVMVGITREGHDKVYQNISQSGTPVIYNGDWDEKDPLGRAEWIKFFGALYNKEELAEELFDSIETNYKAAKRLARKAKKEPTVLAGALFKDSWDLPKGGSWAAKLIADAHADYLYKDTKGSGSLPLSFEEVLTRAQHADYWISPGGFTSYDEMKNASAHYSRFDAFQHKKIFSYAGATGKTGGVLYFEQGPAHPDLILKDLIHIFHPKLLPDYKNTFYKPLE